MKKAVKTVSFMVVAIMLAKIMGLLRDVLMASSYGTSIETSAFSNASQIPLLFFDLTLGAAILSTFIPVFVGFLKTDGKKRAFEFSNNFINLVVLISIIFCIVGIIFSRQFASFIAPGMNDYPPEMRDYGLKLTSSLLIILLPTTIFTTLAYCIVGILQSFDEFNIPAIISLVSNSAVIIYFLFLNKKFGLYGLAIALLIGWSLQVFVQIPSLIKKGYKYRFTINFKDEGIKDVIKLALPILISSWVQPLTVMINKIYASYINQGKAVAALDFSNKLYIIIVGVFAFGITNYIFPSLSKLTDKENEVAFKSILTQSIRVILLIIAPIMAGMMILSKGLITIVYARGAFDQTSINMTSTALFFYSMGMMSFGINEILNKAFFAMKDVKKPMMASICGVITAFVLSYTFIKVFGFGIGALALSAAISATVVSIILLITMNIKNKFLISKSFLSYILKIITATTVMTIATLFVKSSVASFGIIIQLILSTVTGGIVYFISLYLLKIEELNAVMPKLLRKDQ